MKKLLAAILFMATAAKAEVFHGVGGDMVPTPAEIEYQASIGVKTVRLMAFVDPAEVRTMGPEHYFIATVQWLAWIEHLFPYYRQHGIKIILNLHYPPGGYDQQRRAIMLKTPNHWGREYFKQVWRFLAFKYKDSDVIAGFDLINEPHNSARTVRTYQEEITAEIRAITNKTVYQTSRKGRCIEFKNIKRSRFENVKYTCHVYEPWRATHQGTKVDRPTGLEYPSRKFSRRLIEKELAPVARFARLVGPENILIGEGAISWWASDKSRKAWTRDVLELVRPYNWTLFFVLGQGAWRPNDWEPNGDVLNLLKAEFK